MSSNNENLQEKLRTYETQLQKVDELIQKDPENEDWKKLRSDLVEVIDLTKTLIRKEEKKNDDVMLNIRKNAPEIIEKPKVMTETSSWYPVVGDACEALYDSKWYPVNVSDTSSEDESLIVKFYTFGNEERVPLTNLRPLQNIAEIPIQAHQVQVGEQYQALFSADRKWYDAKITNVNSRGASVTYTAYGNTEEVPFEWLRISLSKKNGDSSGLNKSDASDKFIKTTKDEPKFIKISENLKIKPTDSEAERRRKKKRINKIHKTNKRTKIVEKRKAQQSSWLKFAAKKITGKRARKHSIFRTHAGTTTASKKFRQEGGGEGRVIECE